MNREAMIVDPRGESSRMAFPQKSNPNRPAAAAGEPWRETRGEGRPFPERSDPRHAYRPLTEEQRELVTRYMPMAQRLARQSGAKLVRQDELEAEAYAALVEAARTFDPDRGVNFAVHARPRIMGALRDYRRFLFHASWRGERHESPVFERLTMTDDIQGRVLGMEPGGPLGRDFEVHEEVESIIRRLPGSEAVACRLLYVEGKSYEETAATLGCTKGYVSRLHSEALARIRRVQEAALAG